MIKQCALALTVLVSQNFSAKSESADPTIKSARDLGNLIVEYFVEPQNPNVLRSPKTFDPLAGADSCALLAAMEKKIEIGSVADVGFLNLEQMDYQKRMADLQVDVRTLSHSFCGFQRDPQIPVGLPSVAFVTRLNQVRGVLEWAAQQRSGPVNPGNYNVPFRVQDNVNSGTQIYNALAPLNGRVMTGTSKALDQTCFLMGYILTSSTYVQKFANFAPSCAAGLSDARNSWLDIARRFCSPDGYGPEISNRSQSFPDIRRAEVTPDLIQAVERANAQMTRFRARCAP